jgi:hypothetical protein
MSNLFSDSIDEMEKLLVKAKKVKEGSTLEAGVEGASLTVYAQISRRCRDLKVTGQLVVVQGKALRHSIPSSYQRCAPWSAPLEDLPAPVDLAAR